MEKKVIVIARDLNGIIGGSGEELTAREFWI